MVNWRILSVPVVLIVGFLLISGCIHPGSMSTFFISTPSPAQTTAPAPVSTPYQGVVTAEVTVTNTQINTADTITPQSGYPHFSRVDQIKGGWRETYNWAITDYFIKTRDGTQQVDMYLTPTESGYNPLHLTGKIIALDSERFRMDFPSAQAISNIIWRYDETTGDLVSDKNERIAYVGANT
jgi:hypothetical protein